MGLLAGCGGESDSQGEEGGHLRTVAVAGPGTSKMKVEIPSGSPPEHLVVEDLRQGDGIRLQQSKDRIFVKYVGLEYANGREFFNSWESGFTSTFLLEETHEGWERGLRGMRAGGVRKLITPPELEYDTTTFVYVIELRKVEPAAR